MTYLFWLGRWVSFWEVICGGFWESEGRDGLLSWRLLFLLLAMCLTGGISKKRSRGSLIALAVFFSSFDFLVVVSVSRDVLQSMTARGF